MRRLALFLTLALAGCTPNRPYHAPRAIHEDIPLNLRLSFVEFDDQGELWSREQLGSCLEMIRETTPGRPVNLIIFVHGWKHNAASGDANLSAFKEVLVRRASDEARLAASFNRPPEAILGVFVGWRGLSAKGLLKDFSFWNRKQAAHRAGSLSATEALLSMTRALRGRNDGKRSRSVIVGHSFGGLIVQDALGQAFVGLTLGTPESQNVESPVDLAVLVNPATSALGSKQFIEMLRWQGITSVKLNAGGTLQERRPLIVSITSEGDEATRKAFPLGQWFVALTKTFRTTSPDYYWRPPTDALLGSAPHTPCPRPGAPPTQSDLFRNTAGHTTYLHSHYVEEVPNGTTEKPGEILFPTFVDGLLRSYAMRPIVCSWNQTDFWVMAVPRAIIPDHSRIFREPFEDLMVKLLEKATWVDPPQDGQVEEPQRLKTYIRGLSTEQTMAPSRSR